MVKLDLKDYDEEAGALTILGGKGSMDRISYLNTGSEILVRRGGHIKPQRLNEQSVLDIL